jgi:hypothetical protein
MTVQAWGTDRATTRVRPYYDTRPLLECGKADRATTRVAPTMIRDRCWKSGSHDSAGVGHGPGDHKGRPYYDTRPLLEKTVALRLFTIWFFV